MYHFQGSPAIAALIAVGLWAFRSTILPASWLGQRVPSAVVFGDTAALPVMAPTCLRSPETRSTLRLGWAAKQLSGCKPGPSLVASLPTTGRQLIGSSSITATPTLVVSAPRC